MFSPSSQGFRKNIEQEMTETECLYTHDSYLRKFEAEVESVVLKDGKLRIILDKTAFYPTSGGQPNDRGIISWGEESVSAVEITDVVEDGHTVVHLADDVEKLCELERAAKTKLIVTGEIDWDRRVRHMQQHSGQHLFSALMMQIFSLDTVSVHIGNTSTVDFDGIWISDEKKMYENYEKIEKAFNEVVFACKKVWPEYTTKEAAVKAGYLRESDYPKKEGLSKPYRVIHIDGVDACGCCGTHVSSTGEIGLLSIRSIQKVRKTQTRVFYTLGYDFADLATKQRNVIVSLEKTVEACMENLPHVVKNIVESRKSLKKETEKLSDQLAELSMDRNYDKVPWTSNPFVQMKGEEDAADASEVRTEPGSPGAENLFKVVIVDSAPMQLYEDLMRYKAKTKTNIIFLGINRAAKGSGDKHRVYITCTHKLDCKKALNEVSGLQCIGKATATEASAICAGAPPSAQTILTALYKTDPAYSH